MLNISPAAVNWLSRLAVMALASTLSGSLTLSDITKFNLQKKYIYAVYQSSTIATVLLTDVAIQCKPVDIYTDAHECNTHNVTFMHLQLLCAYESAL